MRVERTGGHTGQHQIVYVECGGKTIVFVADLIPTTAHLQDPWVMGYDLFPMDTLAFKQRFIREAIDREYLIVFEHDPWWPPATSGSGTGGARSSRCYRIATIHAWKPCVSASSAAAACTTWPR